MNLQSISLFRPALAALALLAALATAAPAAAGHRHDSGLVRLDLVDRETGLPMHQHGFEGERFVAGRPGHRYSIRLSNLSGERVLAVVSVDGVNVVTGETASPQQSGYVLEPWGSVDIDGWRKSLGEVAAFHFTALSGSYAARTGRPHDVGVVGVAVFTEARTWPRRPQAQLAPPAGARKHGEAAAEGHSRSAPEAKAYADREEALGTGHGQREYAPARHTRFVRASRSPAQVLALRYDSLPRLVAAGIVPDPRDRYPRYGHRPQPFPAGFAPDPWR